MYRMFHKALSAVALLVFLLPAPPAYSEEVKEDKTREVKKGDTLWEISGSELGDPFQWPRVWGENPSVKNPDRLYPGQKLKLPAAPKEGEVVVPEITAPAADSTVPPAPAPEKPEPAEVKITPVTKDYLYTKDEYLAAGYIVKDVPKVGEIEAPVSYRELITNEDHVYLKLKRQPAVGEKFVAVSAEPVRHPVTRKPIGHLVQPLGVVEVVQAEAGRVRAAVVGAYHRMARGNALVDYSEPDMIFLESPRTPELSGHVVAIRGQRLLGGQTDLAFIDQGMNSGVRKGDMFMTLAGPDKNAEIQVIKVEPEASTVVIRKSNAQVNPGDKVTGLK